MGFIMISRAWVVAGIAAALCACSGGGPSFPNGAQCPSTWSPQDMVANIPLNVRMDLSAALPPGKYTYNNAHMDFIEAKSAAVQDPMVVELQDVQQQDGQYLPSTNCLRGARNGLKGMALGTTDIVTDIC